MIKLKTIITESWIDALKFKKMNPSNDYGSFSFKIHLKDDDTFRELLRLLAAKYGVKYFPVGVEKKDSGMKGFWYTIAYKDLDSLEMSNIKTGIKNWLKDARVDKRNYEKF